MRVNVDQMLRSIATCERGFFPLPVFHNPPREIVGNSGVKRPISLIRKNVNMADHSRDPKLSGPRLKAGVTIFFDYTVL
jgi:hypothetical protein